MVRIKLEKKYMCYIENLGLTFYCIKILKFGTDKVRKKMWYIENIGLTIYCINTLRFGTYKLRKKIYDIVLYRKYRFNVLLY